MKRNKTLLIAYDGFDRKEPIPAQAIAIARTLGARLHIVHVTGDAPAETWAVGTLTSGQLHRSVLATRSEQLEKLAARVRKLGIEVETEVRTGNAHVELIKSVVERNADLLMLVDHPKDRVKGPSFGATTMKLLRKCPCPVWAQRSATRSAYRKVLAAVDLGPESDRASSPNGAILEMALMTARARPGTKLYVLHAWTLWGESLLRGPVRTPESEIARLTSDALRERERRMSELLSAHRTEGIEVVPLIAKGEATRLVPAAVEELKVDVLVMGTVARTGLPGLIIGNTAEKILNQVSCSVLTVKPDGFKSPALAAR